MDPRLAVKYDALCAIIASKGKVAVAYSGGVDSTLLLKAASDISKTKVTTLLASSPLQPESEIMAAIDNAAAIGADLHVRHLDPLEWPEFVANPKNRCYHCKKNIYSDFKQYLNKQPDTVLIDGTNLDDLQQDRPGHQAVRELGVATPLVDAKLGKTEIRMLSRSLNLATWNKPSASCLATRIAHGLKIDRNKLAVIARCESYLHDQGVLDCRVRHTVDNNAIIELIGNYFKTLSDQKTRNDLIFFFKAAGFGKVFLDLSERKGNLG